MKNGLWLFCLLTLAFVETNSALAAVEARTPCAAGANNYTIRYGETWECSMPSSATHR